MFSSKLSQNSYLHMHQSPKKKKIKGNPISVKYNKCVSTGNQTSRETSTDTQYLLNDNQNLACENAICQRLCCFLHFYQNLLFGLSFLALKPDLPSICCLFKNRINRPHLLQFVGDKPQGLVF